MSFQLPQNFAAQQYHPTMNAASPQHGFNRVPSFTQPAGVSRVPSFTQPAGFNQAPSYMQPPSPSKNAHQAAMNRAPSFTNDPYRAAQPAQQSLRQASFTLQQDCSLARQKSWEKLEGDTRHLQQRQQQRSFDRERSITQARDAARQHSFTFTAGNVPVGVSVNGYGGYQGGSIDNGGSQLYYEGEEDNGSVAARHATQLTGMVCSISGGSMFLKQSLKTNETVKNRAGLLPCHNTSSFVGRNYTVIKELGQGSFSRVQLLRDRRSGAARVLKISEGGMGTKQSQMLKNEIHLLSALDHPNIVKCFEYSEDIARGQLLMVLEYVGGGDCQQLLRSSAKPQSEAFIAKLIFQLLSALCYCHARGILHCDIKPENMMLTQPSSGKGMPDCKVIDFGLTHRIDQPSRDFIGTPSYMAPEIVTGTVAYTIKADIWSVGVTACELLASMAPFGRPQEYGGAIEPVLQNIRNFTRFRDIESRLCQSQSWMSCSFSAKDFVKYLVIADPADRPHADQALEHAWLEKNKALPSFLSSFMLKSMMKFMGASSLTRRCLLIIAARMGSSKMDQIGDVFLSIDSNHTGHISREALAASVSAAVSCWEPEFDIDDFFEAADQDQKDVVSFLEFAATCIWGIEDTKASVAERVFRALDDNHDGLVHMDDCRHLFRECDLWELHKLPVNNAFGLEEWCFAFGCNNEPPMTKKDQPELSMLAQFMRALICSEDEPGVMHGHELVCS